MISRNERRASACDDAAVDGFVGRHKTLAAAFAIVAVAVAVLAVRAYAPTYDGWTVGGVETCPPPNFDISNGESQPTTWDCTASLGVWLSAAAQGFDGRDPGHAPVVRTTLHEYAGNARFLSNCCLVAVFELSDGTTRAIGVTHLGVDYSRVAVVPYGPDK